ncbi:Gfo/Idh/MocA family protein, partial [Photobacterium sanctipauli]
MKIGVIGLGDIAEKAHLPVLTQLAGVELVFCTRNPERLKYLAEKFRISEYYTDYKDLVKAGVDAVMIHSATSSHFEIARFFLDIGMPVFVDKPLASTYQECEQLHDLAEQKQQPLFVG